MYKVNLKLLERQLTFKGGKSKRVSRLQQPVYYATPTGANRVRTLHPTKGWRDRNVDRISRSMTGLGANEFKLTAME